MLGFDIAGLVLTILIPIFKEGFDILKERRKRKFFIKAESGTSELANDLQSSALEIRNRYNEFHRLIGDSFGRGDGL